MAYLKHPFNEGEQLQILNGKYSFPETQPYGKEVPRLISWMLSQNPERRPSAKVIFEALESIESTGSFHGGPADPVSAEASQRVEQAKQVEIAREKRKQLRAARKARGDSSFLFPSDLTAHENVIIESKAEGISEPTTGSWTADFENVFREGNPRAPSFHMEDKEKDEEDGFGDFQSGRVEQFGAVGKTSVHVLSSSCQAGSDMGYSNSSFAKMTGATLNEAEAVAGT
mmetsp:Transcript_46589/g.120211  ORF Transcript_46589/g.120211 Transcript_46589/m.120211 type:complete len:228 (-) Transcript_46589:520-1203(-)